MPYYCFIALTLCGFKEASVNQLMMADDFSNEIVAMMIRLLFLLG
jgi:hypothetical protein